MVIEKDKNMFEDHKSPLLSLSLFRYRMIRSVFLGLLCVLLTIGIGMTGFHVFEGVSWLDAYLESTMIFGGMGTVFQIQTWEGKLFAGTYALLCPFMLFTTITILFLPILHRFIHKFHLPEKKIN